MSIAAFSDVARFLHVTPGPRADCCRHYFRDISMPFDAAAALSMGAAIAAIEVA